MRERTRRLMAFAFDPTHGVEYGNHLELEVPSEATQTVTIDWNGRAERVGPIGERIAIVDYDASTKKFVDAVELTAPELQHGGIGPTDMNTRFHQQMAYAVASATITNFERALGRSVAWPEWAAEEGEWLTATSAETDDGAEPIRYRRVSVALDDVRHVAFERRLTIYPHAFKLANAYYEPATGLLRFGYFPAAPDSTGRNLPGQAVFTGLDYSVVTSQVVHALLHAVLPHLQDSSSDETQAFHQAFAESIALLQRFTFKETTRAVIERTRGEIHRSEFVPELAATGAGEVIQVELAISNPLLEVATQFGHARGMAHALRAVLRNPVGGVDPDPPDDVFGRAAVLVAAILDTLMTVYHRRTADLGRLSGWQPGNDIHPDLSARLAGEMSRTARHLLRLCIRSLDYCPPVGVSYGDFLRALITADREVRPDDRNGYRAALIDAFRMRGIFPRSALSFSEDALVWPRVRIVEPCGDTAQEVDAFVESHRGELGLLPTVAITRPVRRECSRLLDQSGRLQPLTVLRVVHQKPTGPRTLRRGSTVLLDSGGQVRFAIPSGGDVARPDEGRHAQNPPGDR